MKDRKDRIVKIAVVFGVLALLFLSGLVTLGSIEIAKIKEQITVAESQNRVLIKKLNDITPESLAAEVALRLDVKDGKEGAVGPRGATGDKGKDSQSTTTVIERQTVIEKQLPPENGTNGTNGQEIELAKTVAGDIMWRYIGDRVWLKVPTVDI